MKWCSLGCDPLQCVRSAGWVFRGVGSMGYLRVISCVCVLVTIGVYTARAQDAGVDFLKQVQPVLSEKCLVCHSGSNAQAELRLHTREEMLAGGIGGSAIEPGNGDRSLLVRKMRGEAGMRMPPAGPPIAPETIALIRRWIDEGARFEGVLDEVDHLAPMAPRNPELPHGEASHPVDRFVAHYFAAQGAEMPAPVSDAVFARRVHYDVLGLPPSPDELNAFLASEHEDKREQLIDELLARRAGYAEHWMSFWNDLLRNDEGVIYHGERKSITKWLYQALETNKPYHQMVRELLNPAINEDAEGYLIGVTWRGVVSASQLPPMQASQNAAQVFLGMNLKCAACHDSFVNRWKLADTYGLAALFADDELELVRCDVGTGKMAEARFPVEGIDVSLGESLASRREAAAVWFTHEENGRFARTIVNRYWKLLFGRGLIEPVDDMDAAAWNQDLLDWLASDFTAHDYDLQHLLRTLMTSRAYQLPSVRADTAADDYVFRGPEMRRLTAEQFQDSISQVSGAWRATEPRREIYARYTREWRLKSDPLSRALGRPIRDQVYTERSGEASTLQSLELTNGPLLARRLGEAARSLLGETEPAPPNLYDSRMMRSGMADIDVDVRGADELFLLVQDVDSYDPGRVVTGWLDAKVHTRKRKQSLADADTNLTVRANARSKEKREKAIAGPLDKVLRFPLPAGAERFVAKVAIDEGSRLSEIAPAVRFFVFTKPPRMDRLVRIENEPASRPPRHEWEMDGLVLYLYQHLLGRTPLPDEMAVAMEIAGDERPTVEGVEDLLWALLMSPEFQYLH
jgi:hypothetical protein